MRRCGGSAAEGGGESNGAGAGAGAGAHVEVEAEGLASLKSWRDSGGGGESGAVRFGLGGLATMVIKSVKASKG